MPSIGHVAVGLAAGRAYAGRGGSANKAMLTFAVLSALPDCDALAFAFGIPYDAPLGHRGATHSIAVAVLAGVIGYFVSKPLQLRPVKTALFVTAVIASHGLLDTLTRGNGQGSALLWPFSDVRFWAPVRFIPIAPIGIGMFSARGLHVIAVETVLFAPFWIYALWPRPKKAIAAGSS